jgi:hypothetical protein
VAEAHRFDLRLPLDLHEMLVRSSEEEARSLNREIVHRLRRSFVGQVASAETRERAAAVVPDTPESVAVKAKNARAALDAAHRATQVGEAQDEGGGDAPPAPSPALSLPDTQKAARHAGCRKRPMHHIYHRGRPCPDCGFPE